MKSQVVITVAVCAMLASVAVVGGQRLDSLDQRLRLGAQATVDRESGAAAMARDLSQQKDERHALLTEIQRLEGLVSDLQQERQDALIDLRSDFAESYERLESLMSNSSGQLNLLESSISKLEGAEYATLIQELNANVSQRWSALESRLDQTDGLIEQTTGVVESMDEKISSGEDLGVMWDELMGPVVKLTGLDSVGSGVRLESMIIGGEYRTFVLTAWHVVRDILDDESSIGEIPVTVYNRFGVDSITRATLVDFDATLDVALLQLANREFMPHGAKLASRASMASMRVFQPIIAVGCPLGNDPIPSRGELSDINHFIDGQRYWMINAPTFIGNSGGGIFDAGSHELVGIFSKIYNYGGNQQTIIPHMGLMMPLEQIYTWIEAAVPGSLDNK